MAAIGPVRAAYEAELKSRGFTSDPAQLRAVDALERSQESLQEIFLNLVGEEGVEA